MELSKLKGSIIGIVSGEKKDYKDLAEKKVNEIIKIQLDKSLKMVGLEPDISAHLFKDLTDKDKNKVILASKLQEREIVLYDFSKGMIKKELETFKRLFKKLTSFNKRIILYSSDSELFLNCVDNIYLINNEEIMYETDNIFDSTIYLDADKPRIVEFIYKCEDLGIHLNEYKDLNELIKAIFRIKS